MTSSFPKSVLTPPAGAHLTMDEFSIITGNLLRFTPDALIVVDEQRQIRFANETVTEVFGYAPDALIGRPLEVLIPQRLRTQHEQATARYIDHPTNREMGARVVDLLALRADGTEFAAGIRLSPFRVDGKLFVAAAIRDMSENRRTAEALMAAREEADRANRAKSRFLATASHDLRQPLQTIRLLNAAMLKLVPEPNVHELLQQQGQAIESMTRLLNGLLDISRFESGAVQLTPVEVPLRRLFEDLRSEFESLARTRDITLKVQAPVLVLSTDRTLLYQLLQNLLGNALKYTDHGSVSLSCRASADAVTILVEDTGIGIPEDKLERIFDEYYQVDTHGAKRMGVGLGLAIVKEVARLLGFTVRVTSQIGVGTQAEVTIPAQYLVSRANVADLSAVQSVASTPDKSRVILVEDNDGVRLATELFLKLEGYQTLSASSVAEAQALFATIRRGDIVIADYHLDSKQTGLQMLLELRKRLGYEVPGIVLSGDLTSVRAAVGNAVPNCTFLSKPVDTTALVEAIGALSASSRDEDRGAAQLSRAQAL